jgi:hypothetical protein
MADTKVSALTANTTPLSGDYLLQVDDPGGTPTSKRMTIGDLSIANAPFQGFLVNGYISRSVATNNLTVAIKTIAGSDPSTLDPVYIRIGNSVRTLTAALSITINAGTDTFGLGAAGCLTDQDLFAYLGYRAAGAAVFIAVSRLCHGRVYSDFSSTATNEKYLAYSGSAPASTDEVECIGRFNATNSGSASYNWSVPATSIVISRPIYQSRQVSYQPTYSASGSMTFTSVTTDYAQYQVIGPNCLIDMEAHGTTGGVASTALFATLPFECLNSALSPALAGWVADGSGTIGGAVFITAGTPDKITGRKYDLSNYGLGASRYIAAKSLYPIE